MSTKTVIGTGIAFPGEVVTSEAISDIYGLSVEWADHFIGTHNRYFALDLNTGEQIESLESLAKQASMDALEKSGFRTEDVDFLVLATATPDELMPSTANRIACSLGITHIPTYQIQSGCAGAVQAFDLARMLLERDDCQIGLIVGGDVCVRHLEINPDLTEAKTSELVNYLIFGDGVGAAVITSKEEIRGLALLDVINEMTAIGQTVGQIIRWYGQADFNKTVLPDALSEDYKAIEQLVPLLAGEVLGSLLERQGWAADDLQYVLPPQLAGKISEQISAGLETGTARIINCVAETGNCGNALPFIQLHEVFDVVKAEEKLVCICIESSMWIKGGLSFKGVAK